MVLENAFGFDTTLWGLAIIAFLRVTTVLFFLPIFGGEGMPVRVRVLLGLVMTLAVWPILAKSVPTSTQHMTMDSMSLAIATLREVFLGFAIGFSCRMVLVAASIAANMIGLNMGFQTAATLSPIFQTQDSIFAVFKNWIVILLMLSFNIHHKFIEYIFESFKRVPVSGTINSDLILKNAVAIIETCFTVGTKIAAPFLVIQLMITLALGLLSRLVPQLNAFIASFPITYLISMVLLFFALGSIATIVARESREHQSIMTSNMITAFEKN